MSRDFKTMQDIFDDINRAQQLYIKGDFVSAYNIIKEEAATFDMLLSANFHGDNFGKKEYENIYLLAGDICGELQKNDEALNFYKKHLYLKLQIKSDFQNFNSVKLFQFRNTKEYTLNNLRNNELTLVDPRIQNDIVDSIIFPWLENFCGKNAKHKKHIPIYKAAFNFLRATSFCSDSENRKAVENPLMWAHYANNHKGICVEYDLEQKDITSNHFKQATLFRLLQIKYLNPYEKSEILDFSDDNTTLTLKNALACKSIDWNYENEVRMIAYTPTDDSKYSQISLDTPNPIKAIYFGFRCPTQRKNAVRKIFENRPDVKFYQMKINLKNIHRLTFDPC